MNGQHSSRAAVQGITRTGTHTITTEITKPHSPPRVITHQSGSPSSAPCMRPGNDSPTCRSPATPGHRPRRTSSRYSETVDHYTGTTGDIVDRVNAGAPGRTVLAHTHHQHATTAVDGDR